MSMNARWQHWRRLSSFRLFFFSLLAVLAYVVPLVSISSGAVAIPAETISAVIQDRLAQKLGIAYDSGLDYTDRTTARNATLILDIRLPRVILAALVGVALALAGVALQGVLRNPLADPGLIGISSGAALGAVTAIVAGWSLGGERLAQALAGFVAGIATTYLVYQLSAGRRYTESTTLLLVGLAINAIAASYIGMATFIGGQGAVGDITFWTLGSLAGAFWRDVYIMLPFVLLGAGALPFLATQLNLMALGEVEARHLGVDVLRLRALVLGVAALLVGVGVALVGMVAFVGLVVPHLMRTLFGPDHRVLLPTSAVGGALFLLVADLFARSVVTPTEIPLGVVTTLVGGPLFLFLVLLHRR